MIITIKNLQQQTFAIEFNPDKTVLELKKKIHSERGPEYLVEKQKLIYAGVILENERTINSYKVDDKKFIVVMLTRDVGGNISAQSNLPQEKAVEQSKPNNDSKCVTSDEGANKASSSTKDDSQGQRNECEKQVETVETTIARTATNSNVSSRTVYTSNDLVGELANASLQSRAESNLLMGDDYNRTVESMIEMGYDRAQVEQAMVASYNNPERAVEYLINGLPEDDDTFNNDPGMVSANDDRESSHIATNASETLTNTDGNADPFEFLRRQPQFLQMRSLVYQNPDLLQAVLQQIGQTNPALLQLISENQDAFLHMINQPLDGESDNRNQQPAAVNSGPPESIEIAAAESHDVEGQIVAVGGAPTSRQERSRSTNEQELSAQSENIPTIRLTSQDQDAIERLKALGFPEALVLQAYFACEKDEQMAANFLISSAFDD